MRTAPAKITVAPAPPSDLGFKGLATHGDHARHLVKITVAQESPATCGFIARRATVIMPARQ